MESDALEASALGVAMMSMPWIVGVATLAYLGILFVVARFGDRRRTTGYSVITPTVYALAIAVYCTSWTYYGSVGRATTGGFSFLTIYLGPTIMLLFAPVMIKMLRISKALRLTSIADFIAARYGKSQVLAAIVTIIAVIGIIPYIALQLKAISFSLNVFFPGQSIETLSNTFSLFSYLPDSTALIAVIMAVSTIWFGARHLDVTDRHEGMVLAISFDSVFKLAAFLFVGAYVVWGLNDGFQDIFARSMAIPNIAKLLDPAHINYPNWFTLMLLSGLAILMLPRQFQITIVENVEERHMRRAIWMFPLYMLLINIFVLPIALTGLMNYAGTNIDPDTFVLRLPIDDGHPLIALVAYLGGMSAATAMIVVETVALSTMVSNDLVIPLVLQGRQSYARREDLSGMIMKIRRFTIVGLLAMGYVYFRMTGNAYALVSIGLISFLAVAQFAPVLLGGMFWREGNRSGAISGLLLGFAVWIYTALLPSFAKSGWIDQILVEKGPWGLQWLAPQGLFGLTSLDPISHAFFWSMLVNIGAYVAVSVTTNKHPVEIATADQFVNIQTAVALDHKMWRGTASTTAIKELLVRFLGARQAQNRLHRYLRSRGLDSLEQLQGDAPFVSYAEKQLAGAIGSASAHVMLSSVVKEEELKLDEVLNILEEASQAREQSRVLERKSSQLEVATRELREANEKLRALDRLKDDFMSTVTHELRTPLTSIRAFSEMLLADPEMDVKDRTRFLEIVVSEAERLTRLINQILDFAKLESGHADWEITRVDLGALVKETAESLEQLFRERGAVYALQLPPSNETLWVNIDRDRLKQVVINLLSNAVKFVPVNSGMVTISVNRQEGSARVSVHDNGPGIDPAYQAQVFERFRQGGDSLTDKPQGTGLGLPISREIVEHFGGRIWLEETSVDRRPITQGATFVFTIPLADMVMKEVSV
jgi:Na+/proline symporter/nitrogen-specific signal transduction histidine kinase